jgi:regulator of sirC expression with transglutaminase-like and TPR domain
LIAVQNRLIVLLPQAWTEYRDRGLAYAEAGQTGRALEDLETYLVNAEKGVDIDAIAKRAAELRGAKR